jgi:preprotein translocase subunit SecE
MAILVESFFKGVSRVTTSKAVTGDRVGSTDKSSSEKNRSGEGKKDPSLTGAEPGFSKNFFSESVGELKKITTPTRQETFQATIMTIIIIIFMSLCVFLLDLVFNGIMSSIL